MRPILTSASPSVFQSQLKDNTLGFDAFFPVHYALDVLSRTETAHPNEQSWLADSMLVLLNWDVQNSLRKCINQTSGDWFSNWLKNLYENITRTFENVAYTDGPVKLMEQKALSDAENDPSGVFFAVQISHRGFFNTYLINLESSLHSIEACISRLPDTVPSEGSKEVENTLGELERNINSFSKLVDAFKLSLDYRPEQDISEMFLEDLSQTVSGLLPNISQEYSHNASSVVEQLAELKFYLDAYQKKLNNFVLKFSEKQKVKTGTEETPSVQSTSPEESILASSGEAPLTDTANGPGQKTVPTGGYSTPAKGSDEQEEPGNA